MCSNFLGYLLNSEAVRSQYDQGATGAIQTHFNVGMAKELQVTVPPIEEQSKIARWLRESWESQTGVTNRLRASTRTLKEYRQALITAAVTGQLDIPEATP